MIKYLNVLLSIELPSQSALKCSAILYGWESFLWLPSLHLNKHMHVHTSVNTPHPLFLFPKPCVTVRETVSLLPHASWLQSVCLIISGSRRLALMRVLLNWLPQPTMFCCLALSYLPLLQAGVRRFSDSTVFIVLSVHCASRTQQPYYVTAAQGTILATTVA